MKYLDSSDYQTIWQLAHGLVGKDSRASDPDHLATDVKESIYRVLVAIRKHIISARDTSGRLIFEDDSFLAFLVDFSHMLKFYSCQMKGQFNQHYLESIYLWRPEVLKWCDDHQLPVPQAWQTVGANFASVATSAIPSLDNIPTQEKSVSEEISRRAKKNAQIKYQALYEIKRNFIRYYHSNDFETQGQAAGTFFITLSEQEKRELVPSLGSSSDELGGDEVKAVRTLTSALREFKDNKPAPWLEGFTL